MSDTPPTATPLDDDEPQNPVLRKLADILENADKIYVPDGRRSVRLDDPALPVKRARRWVIDRLNELER